MDRMLNIVFISIRSMLDRDRVKYEDYIKKQSENGRKGWRPKKSDANPENPPVILETHWNPTKPKKADSASVSAIDIASSSEKISETKISKLSDEWIKLLEWEETFTSIIAQALIDIGWKPKETVEEFVEWVKKKMEANKIEECEKDFYKLKSGLSSFVDHFSSLKVKNHKATLWSNFCLRFNLK